MLSSRLRKTEATRKRFVGAVVEIPSAGAKGMCGLRVLVIETGGRKPLELWFVLEDRFSAGGTGSWRLRRGAGGGMSR